MESFRKYYGDRKLRSLLENEPDWGVTVRTVGHCNHKPKTNYPDHKHPDSYYFDWKKGRILKEFQLVYISNGKGTFEAEGTSEMNVEAGSAFLLFPGVWHRYHPCPDTGWEEFWVGFDGPYVDYLMKQDCFKPASPFIRIGFNTELLNVFVQLIENVKYEGVAYSQLSSCLITQLLGLVYSSALIGDASRQSKKKIIHEARFKLHECLYQNIDIELLARELNVSYPWFRKTFKEVMGVAPGQYHLNIRLEKACKLLKETNLTIVQIAEHLGFESEFYFSRIFKKKMQLSPRPFRLANRNETTG